MFDKTEKVVKEGIFTYDGILKMKVQIIKSDVSYGSGDYEDSQENQVDREIECYYIRYESNIVRDFFTLGEAIKEVENQTNYTVTWIL